MDDLCIHSPLLNDELGTFVEYEDGKLGAADNCKDDRVMALANLVMGLERAALYARPSPDIRWGSGKVTGDPFIFDNILNELKNRQGVFPISHDKQLGWDS